MRNNKRTLQLLIKFMISIISISMYVGDNYYNLRYLKYFFIFIFSLFIFSIYVLNKSSIHFNNTIVVKERFNAILIECIFLVFFSLLLQLIKGNLNFRFIYEVLFIFMPYAFVYMIFLVDYKNIEGYIDILFINLTILFILTFYNKFTLTNFKSLNFNNSYSPFESSYGAYFLLLFFWYLFKEFKIKTFISLFFCILSFKRLDLVFILFIFFLKYILKINKKNINSNINKFTALIMVIINVIGIYLMKFLFSPWFSNYFQVKTGISYNAFTSGRYYITNLALENKDIMAAGFGSLTVFVKSLGIENYGVFHCDFLKIYLELTIFGFIIFFYFFYKISNKNLFIFIMCLIINVNFLVVHVLDSSMFNLLFFMLILGFSFTEKT